MNRSANDLVWQLQTTVDTTQEYIMLHSELPTPNSVTTALAWFQSKQSVLIQCLPNYNDLSSDY